MRSIFHVRYLAAGFLAALLAVEISASQPENREPDWDGKTLSEWVEMSKGPSRAGLGKGYDVLLEEERPHTAQQVQAMSVIRGIGTNALPSLLEWLRTDRFRDALAGFEALGEGAEPAVSQLIKLVEGGAEAMRDKAILALGEIGPAAGSAAPALRRELRKGNINAAIAVGQIGIKDAAVIRELSALLDKEKENWAQQQVVIALGNIGPAAAPLTEKLLKLLGETEAALAARTGYFQVALFRQRTVEALGKIGDKRALPTLKRMLEEKKNPGNVVNLALRRALMRALADFGPAAKGALPILSDISANPHIEALDKAVATEAIIRINAQAL